MISIDDVKFSILKTCVENDGKLVAIEGDRDIPFRIERIFYVYGVKDQNDRGKHGHYESEQVLICLYGKITVICKDGKDEAIYELDKPNQSLYIPSMIWDEQIYHNEDSILMVLSNLVYDTEDYIEDWEQFVSLKEKE